MQMEIKNDEITYTIVVTELPDKYGNYMRFKVLSVDLKGDYEDLLNMDQLYGLVLERVVSMGSLGEDDADE